MKNKKILIVLFSFLLVPVLGYIDFLTGWELGFFVFYFIPIVIVAWYATVAMAMFVSIVSAIAWLIADFAVTPHYDSLFFAYWNSFIRLAAFLVIAVSISKTRTLLQKEKKISKELRDTIIQMKTLKGLLPICASCKKIRNDKGYWEQIEYYIKNHSEAEFTHGICQECARKLYPQLFMDDITGRNNALQEQEICSLKK